MVHSLSMPLALLATLMLATLGNGLAITYCSSSNTADNQAGKQENHCFTLILSNTLRSILKLPIEWIVPDNLFWLRICCASRWQLLVLKLCTSQPGHYL